MIRQPSSSVHPRPMAVKMAVASPRRPALQIRWSWLLLAILALLIAATVAGTLVLVR